MACKYSIIVPVYNSEKSIAKCIVSILSQTEPNFELLLIDDGSTDESGNICDSYAARDRRVKVIHKKNGGVSNARNVGIENAVGEWITFIDSDDWVTKDFLKVFSQKELDKESFYIQGCTKYRGDENYEIWMHFEDSTINLRDVKKYSVLNKVLIYGTPWAKLYNLKLLKEGNIRFNEQMNLHEDHVFYFEYITNIESIHLSSRNEYVYNVEKRETSLSRGKYIDYNAEKEAMNILKSNFFRIQDGFSLNKFRFREVKTMIYGLPFRAFISALRQNKERDLIKKLGRNIPIWETICYYRPHGIKHIIAKYYYLKKVIWSYI